MKILVCPARKKNAFWLRGCKSNCEVWLRAGKIEGWYCVWVVVQGEKKVFFLSRFAFSHYQHYQVKVGTIRESIKNNKEIRRPWVPWENFFQLVYFFGGIVTRWKGAALILVTGHFLLCLVFRGKIKVIVLVIYDEVIFTNFVLKAKLKAERKSLLAW